LFLISRIFFSVIFNIPDNGSGTQSKEKKQEIFIVFKMYIKSPHSTRHVALALICTGIFFSLQHLHWEKEVTVLPANDSATYIAWQRTIPNSSSYNLESVHTK